MLLVQCCFRSIISAFLHNIQRNTRPCLGELEVSSSTLLSERERELRAACTNHAHGTWEYQGSVGIRPGHGGWYFHESVVFPGGHPRPWWTPLQADWWVQAGGLGQYSPLIAFRRVASTSGLGDDRVQGDGAWYFIPGFHLLAGDGFLINLCGRNGAQIDHWSSKPLPTSESYRMDG